MINYDLYLVTDRGFRNDELHNQVKEAITGGVTCVQLREKNISNEEFINLINDVKKVTDEHNVPLIINDNVEVALETKIKNIHLGQSDLNKYEFEFLKNNFDIIGISVANLEQAIEAEKNGAHYLGVGAIYATKTKTDAEMVSLETLKEIKAKTKIPIVAIGGIKKDNFQEVFATKIDGVALVSEILSAQDLHENTKVLKTEVDKWKQYYQ